MLLCNAPQNVENTSLGMPTRGIERQRALSLTKIPKNNAGFVAPVTLPMVHNRGQIRLASGILLGGILLPLNFNLTKKYVRAAKHVKKHFKTQPRNETPPLLHTLQVTMVHIPPDPRIHTATNVHPLPLPLPLPPPVPLPLASSLPKRELKCGSCGKLYVLERFYLAHVLKCALTSGTEDSRQPPFSGEPQRQAPVQGVPAPQAPSIGIGTRASSSMIPIAVVNEGKLSAPKTIIFSQWAAEHGIKFVFISEAARCFADNLAASVGFHFVGPKVRTPMERVGGAGFLIHVDQAADTRKCRYVEGADKSWAVATIDRCGITMCSVYISPDNGRAVAPAEAAWDVIHAESTLAASMIVAGDMNAPLESHRRQGIDERAAGCALTILNSSAATHFSNGAPKNIDLIYFRGVAPSDLALEQPERGHARQVFTVEPLQPGAVKSLRADWRLIADPNGNSAFCKRVSALCEAGIGIHDSIRLTAEELPRTRGPHHRKNRWTKKLLSAARSQLRGLTRGTKQFEESFASMAAIYRVEATNGFRAFIVKLAESTDGQAPPALFRLQASLARMSNPSLGPRDSSIAEVYSHIFNDNTSFKRKWLIQKRVRHIDHRLDRHFSALDISQALKKLKNGKASGVDCIPHEAYKALATDTRMIQRFAQHANMWLREGWQYPVDGRLVTIPKGHKVTSDPGSMRPLMMLTTERKLAEQLVASRISASNEVICLQQSGFAPGRDCCRQLFALRCLMENAVCRKSPLILIFHDLEKAFDRIPRGFVISALRKKFADTSQSLLALAESLLMAERTIKVGGVSIVGETGVMQGGPLSPILFTMAIDQMLKTAASIGPTLEEIPAGALAYADDITTADTSVACALRKITFLKDSVDEWGGKWNHGKMEMQIINESMLSPNDISRLPTTRQDSCNCLGVKVNQHGLELKHKPEQMTALFHGMMKPMGTENIPVSALCQMLRSSIWTKLTYCFEVVLPDPNPYIRCWFSTLRYILKTYNSTPAHCIQQEMGLLTHPVWFLCVKILKFLWRLMNSDDELMKGAVGSLDDSNGFWESTKVWLKRGGTTLAELKRCSWEQVRQNARLSILTWTEAHVNSAACSIQPQQVQIRHYLRNPLGNFGFIFRQKSLGPPDHVLGECRFCAKHEGDHGAHYTLGECSDEANELPTDLLLVIGADCQKSMRLEDDQPKEAYDVVLNWMKNIWTRRQQITTEGKKNAEQQSHLEFLDPSCHSPLPPTKRILKTEAQRIREGQIKTANNIRSALADTRLRNEGSWCQLENDRFLHAVNELGLKDAQQIANFVGSRDRRQILEKMRGFKRNIRTRRGPGLQSSTTRPRAASIDKFVGKVRQTIPKRRLTILPASFSRRSIRVSHAVASDPVRVRAGLTKWSAEDNQALLDALRSGINKPAELKEKLPQKTIRSIYDKMQTKGIKSIVLDLSRLR